MKSRKIKNRIDKRDKGISTHVNRGTNLFIDLFIEKFNLVNLSIKIPSQIKTRSLFLLCLLIIIPVLLIYLNDGAPYVERPVNYDDYCQETNYLPIERFGGWIEIASDCWVPFYHPEDKTLPPTNLIPYL